MKRLKVLFHNWSSRRPLIPLREARMSLSSGFDGETYDVGVFLVDEHGRAFVVQFDEAHIDAIVEELNRAKRLFPRSGGGS
ncbi:MAG TPA: hypothetical protein VEA38_07165 [Terriglobales bacterium]|nr:hypothetical protein [Terriglobales bacterium]